MKSRNIVFIIVLLFLSIATLLYAKILLLPTYVYDGVKLVYIDNVYIARNYYTGNETYNLGKPIGIAIQKGSKRTFSDLIFGDRVYEYKDDKEHNHIYVKVFMDGSRAFDRVSK